MTITNGYCTLLEYKAYATARGQTNATARGQTNATDANDDIVIEGLIETASRYIDDDVNRTFYARTETHYYNLPLGTLSLYIDDDDLLTVTGLTNGDGTPITSLQYNLYPLNKTPKYEIRLKWSQNVYWQWANAGDSDAAIGVVGTWGYSAAAPKDIATLTMAIALNLYRRRHGENVASKSTVTAAGVVITPEGIPEWGEKVLAGYRRLV